MCSIRPAWHYGSSLGVNSLNGQNGFTIVGASGPETLDFNGDIFGKLSLPVTTTPISTTTTPTITTTSSLCTPFCQK
ncbi:MAG: hypothetical protein MRQ09_02165 [Candidatus Midichloria sp.]|nr:hypothetical protein [Candidatus Midichloria sp.]